MTKKEALKILKLNESADEEEIKKAFRKLSLVHHPDKNNGSKESEEEFKKINEAYRTLTGKEEEKLEDIFSEFSDLNSIFSFTFGNSFTGDRSAPKKKESPALTPIVFPAINLGTKLIDTATVLFREKVELKVEIKAYCQECVPKESWWVPCKQCDQLGSFIKQEQRGFFVNIQQHQCNTCKGRGWMNKKHCKSCNDSLIVSSIRQILIKLPENFNGHELVINNAGHRNYLSPDSNVIFKPMFVVPDLSKLDEETKNKIRQCL